MTLLPSNAISILTSISISAIATNIKVKGSGPTDNPRRGVILLEYACGLKLGPALTLSQNPIFEMASRIRQVIGLIFELVTQQKNECRVLFCFRIHRGLVIIVKVILQRCGNTFVKRKSQSRARFEKPVIRIFKTNESDIDVKQLYKLFEKILIIIHRPPTRGIVIVLGHIEVLARFQS